MRAKDVRLPCRAVYERLSVLFQQALCYPWNSKYVRNEPTHHDDHRVSDYSPTTENPPCVWVDSTVCITKYPRHCLGNVWSGGRPSLQRLISPVQPNSPVTSPLLRRCRASRDGDARGGADGGECFVMMMQGGVGLAMWVWRREGQDSQGRDGMCEDVRFKGRLGCLGVLC